MDKIDLKKTNRLPSGIADWVFKEAARGVKMTTLNPIEYHNFYRSSFVFMNLPNDSHEPIPDTFMFMGIQIVKGKW